jgi:hypothetical protein
MLLREHNYYKDTPFFELTNRSLLFFRTNISCLISMICVLFGENLTSVIKTDRIASLISAKNRPILLEFV